MLGPRSLLNSIRGRLILLVAAITVPALVLVALLTAQAYRNERQSVSRHLISTARALAGMVNNKVAQGGALLTGLATSPELEHGDLASFEARLRSLPLEEGTWLVLSDADGRQLVNTRSTPGRPLPQMTFTSEFRKTIEAGRTYFSNLTDGALTRDHVLYVAVPIIRSGQLRHVLCFAMLPQALASSFDVERMLPDVVVSVVDREGTIAVRHPNAARYVGKKVTADIVMAIATHPEGVVESRTLEGVRVIAAFSHAPASGWSVAIGVPYAELYRSAGRLLSLGYGLAVVLIGAAVGLSLWIGRGVVRSVESLVRDTITVGSGTALVPHSSGLAETDFVHAAIRKMARSLSDRREENQKLNDELKVQLDRHVRADEEKNRLAAIVEGSDDAIISKDLKGIIRSWNRGAEKIFGYTAEEIVGRSILTLIPPERQSEETTILERIARGESIEHFETRRQRKDGSIVPISLTVSPVRDEKGRIIGASKIARDVTERLRIQGQQQALYELVATASRAEALPQIYDAALSALQRCYPGERAAILRIDEDGRMRFKAFRGLSERYREAAAGHSPWAPGETQPRIVCVPDASRDGSDGLAAPAIAAEEGIVGLVHIPLRDENRLLGELVLYTSRPLDPAQAEWRAAETIASQVAFAIERREAARALEQLVDERTASLREVVSQMQEFSYSVSHDLRSPVRAMRGYAEALLQDHGEAMNEEARDWLARIVRSGARMDRLIQDLLIYTRLSRRDLSLEPVNLDKLVREISQEHVEVRSHAAEIEVNGALPAVIAHEPSLTQVLSNLLSNAVKFVPEQTRPHVKVRSEERAEGTVRVWVEDNGIGIKPEHHSRLFGMFERVHPEKKFEGTGIGLAIVRRAITRMGGEVGVESDGVAGTRFWFELRKAEPETTRAAEG